MDAIYDEMVVRNTTWLTTNNIVYDPLLLCPQNDQRKCIALVGRNPVELIDTSEIDNICDPLSDKWMKPKIHSTFIVLRGWQTSNFDHEEWTPLKDIICKTLVPYEIIFDRVIPVKTGLVLCGTPSIDINSVRDEIRHAGYDTNSSYKCDIAHTTILRWTHELDPNTQSEWLKKIISLPRKPYAKIKVTSLDIILASWSMHPDTTKIIDSIPILPTQ